MTGKPRLIVFASGTEDGGGSGFENLVKCARNPLHSLSCDIVGVVSNHAEGGVCRRAERLGIPFFHFNGPYTAENYQRVVAQAFGAPLEDEVSLTGWVALSGWLKHVSGLDPRRTFNIHPALLSVSGGQFGGEGMYGMHIHCAVHAALQNDEITHSGISMHFVTDAYDTGPVFFEQSVPLNKKMTPEHIQKKINALEHHWQSRITNMVIHEKISWDGKNFETLTVPPEYPFLPLP